MTFLNCSSVPKLLIVDDDPCIREFNILVFQDAGFHVVEASDGDEAAATLGRLGSTLAALFSDINMPGSLDGLQLANYARREWPLLGIVLASGRGLLNARDLPERCRFMPKPYTAIAIVDCVRSVIAGGAREAGGIRTVVRSE